jgi:hypothetical protein
MSLSGLFNSSGDLWELFTANIFKASILIEAEAIGLRSDMKAGKWNAADTRWT